MARGAFPPADGAVTFSGMSDPALLAAHLAGHARLVLGFSGGVDSSLLAVVAHRALGPARVRAVLGVSPAVPEAECAAARAFAAAQGFALHEVATRELDDADYRANAPDRCYFCKRELWRHLAAIADLWGGGAVVIDGTHADDLQEHRPGRRAADERGVRSPFAELGWTKADIRACARQLGLPTADQPAAPCLASRIRYGLEVTSERLRQVEAAEAALRAAGITGDLRVRHHGTLARVEVAPEQLPQLQARWPMLEPVVRAAGFATVELDPRGYRRGALLAVLDSTA